ncbi:uncharacterized protein LACBIDRAFT_328686 [Laccaria bicolor S238N-H82]|uniref:Predicted protein n=1 Tax=Laccaria bicolor (strain S238N-H82 / ATCC MYA-4686) TaxID=486041 RepID=B0DFP2_LACBS|nr:uncharacterized protein LACBIDRAFT_328686 [Laccaria bicolor S238N-H82]EDR06494.1 predicted protein [Laccaria bicolor S238N-H82]|eukprot:XP_001882866.1 predicted protein [Laccaria bicolor S238N-H82]
MSILEWNSKWYATTESLQYDTASYNHLDGVERLKPYPGASFRSIHYQPSGCCSRRCDETFPHLENSYRPSNWWTNRGPLFMHWHRCSDGISPSSAQQYSRYQMVKAPIPGPENTDAEMTEKPIVIPLQPTYSRGVISFDIASDVNEHGHSSADSRLTMGSETTAEFYVNSLNIPSPFSTNFRASVVTRIRDLEEVDPSIRPGRDGSSTLFSYSAP